MTTTGDDRPEAFDALRLSRADAQTYAAAVRAHLSDLPAEELDELTGGLEADLADLAAESATPLAARLGEPRAYAHELRAAAGLEPQTRAARALSRLGRSAQNGSSVATPLAGRAGRVQDWLAAQAWWPQVRDFTIALRPAWWVFRAWVAFTILSSFLGVYPIDLLPDTFGGWVAQLGFVIVSVQLGRTRHEQASWLRTAVVLGNVAAVLAIPAATSRASDHWMAYEPQATSSPSGLYLDGEPVLNLFPYGADGQPLSGVQLFDANGRPITLAERADYSGPVGRPFAPYTDAIGEQVWNAYPLYAGRYDNRGESYRPGSVRPPNLPFVLAPSITAPAVAPSPAATSETGPTAGPTASPTDSSTVSPPPTAVPTVSAPPAPTTPVPSVTTNPTPS